VNYGYALDTRLLMLRLWTEKTVRFLKAEDGPTAVEYAVMLALIVVVCIAAITQIGSSAHARVLFAQTREPALDVSQDDLNLVKGSQAWFVVDPPNGKIPPLTQEGRDRAAARRLTSRRILSAVTAARRCRC